MPRALLSVTDKTGIVEFAKVLVGLGYEIVSTGGTARTLADAGVAVTKVEQVTGSPEMLDGRVKTLHPSIHGGLLGIVSNPAHVSQMKAAGIEPIGVVAVNLYAFEQTVSGTPSLGEAIESIDIGGPAMIRAAAKNHASVLVLVEPSDYQTAGRALATGEGCETLRRQLAAKAFRHTAYYDSIVSRYLSSIDAFDPLSGETLTTGFRRRQAFRYGENPHQNGALYRDPLSKDGIANAEQLSGKELSYNNLLDADAAWELVCDLPQGACAIIKHGNPCGAAATSAADENYRLARASDPISAFGGIAAVNGLIDEDVASAMAEKGNFLEVVIGAGFTDAALELFANRSGWGQDVRLLRAAPSPGRADLSIRTIRGGALIQHTDEDPGVEAWQVVSDRRPSEDELAAARFVWKIVPHVKSNAIVVGNSQRLFGIGAGQMNRVQSVRLALEQAGELARGAALASDAFFPFPDSVETAAASGIKTIIQPGGSKKDAQVIEAANSLGISMILTGVRHFRH